MEICTYNKCTGCMACYNNCPRHSISMKYDKIGTLLPIINLETCIHCNLCSNICPSNKILKTNNPIEAFACWNLDEEKRKQSSSGGLATTLYEHFINKNGIVYGCSYEKNLQLIFSSATNLIEIEKFKTSKYSQAYIGNIFKEILSYLNDNKEILFIGTPCQVAGLKSYLKRDFENLTTVDIICHGVPSQKYIDEYIEYLNLPEKPDNITFRGLYNFYFTLYKNSKVLYSKKAKDDFYFYSFLNGLFYRESCYDCNFANSSRIGDITIGDFWGLGKEKPFNHDTSLGVSLCLINTDKGINIFNNIKNKLFFEKREISEAIAGNDQLRHPSIKNSDFNKFQELYLKYGFEYAINKCFNKEEL